MAMGDVLRQAREAAGLDIAAVAIHGHVSRGHLCNVEKGRRTATPAVIVAYERALGMHRRQLFRLAGASFAGLIVSPSEDSLAHDLFASIASGDDGPLAQVQTSHSVDHAIRRLAVREKHTLARMVSWMETGADPVLRVNAAGILAKTQNPELADDVALALARDDEARELYLKAVRERVGTEPDALVTELANNTDSGARWCATYLLTRSGNTRLLIPAMRNEPSRENLRAMALALAAGDT